jgi:phage repressor protein C with HTH and peptisase S24 domain
MNQDNSKATQYQHQSTATAKKKKKTKKKKKKKKKNSHNQPSTNSPSTRNNASIINHESSSSFAREQVCLLHYLPPNPIAKHVV